jgi:hypothetical protein
MQNDESQDHLARKCDKLIWEIELLFVYAREDQNSVHCNEIYSACQHKMRFHRFLKEHQDVKNTSSDEGNKQEKIWMILRNHHLVQPY